MVKEHIGKLSERKIDSHKGDYGKVLVVAGSKGMTGAAFLTAQGALYSGSGLVKCAIPGQLNSIMETKLTEVMTLPVPGTEEGTFSVDAEGPIMNAVMDSDVVAMGPGIGRHPHSDLLVRALIDSIDRPLILDADALNALEGDLDILKNRQEPTVITPHPGEMSSLLGKDILDIQADRTGIAVSVAEIAGVIVCLKGHNTVVAAPDGKFYVNDTGNSGMSSGGTGDVLTGIIASFAGQGISLYSAVVSAVYLHGLAGDLAAEEIGQFSLTASDLLDYLPEAFSRAGI